MIGEPYSFPGDVPLEEWKRLYEAAIKVRELEPWKRMDETDLFGVRAPGGDTMGFVSVMGAVGEYHAIAVYPGPKALEQFLFAESGSDVGMQCADHVLGIPQIHATFGCARDVQVRDKKIVKDLGLRFRGPHSWPYFRSYHPGFYPWYIERHEVQWLTVAMEQLLDLAPRIEEGSLLLKAKNDDDRILVREPEVDRPDSPWKESWQTFPPEPTTVHIAIPGDLVESVRSLSPTRLTFEIDFFPTSFQVGKKGDRPVRPYALMVMDAETLFIISVEMFQVESTLEHLWTTIPEQVLKVFKKNDICPGTIAIHNPMVEMILSGICDELGIKIERREQLEGLSSARSELDQLNRR